MIKEVSKFYKNSLGFTPYEYQGFATNEQLKTYYRINKIEELIQLRDNIFAWARIELKDIIVFNTDAKIEILINMRGLKHTLKEKSFKNSEMIELNEVVIMSVKHLKFFLKLQNI